MEMKWAALHREVTWFFKDMDTIYFCDLYKYLSMWVPSHDDPPPPSPLSPPPPPPPKATPIDLPVCWELIHPQSSGENQASRKATNPHNLLVILKHHHIPLTQCHGGKRRKKQILLKFACVDC